MENRLAPFVPMGPLGFVAWRAQDVGVDVQDMCAEYGFKANSKQHNFLTRSATPDRVVVLLHTAAQGLPRHMADPAVVARAFGTVRAKSHELELWHISVRREHPLNDSHGGARWGVFGIACDSTARRVTWATPLGVKLTPHNASEHVHGTPNPYAVECLVRFVELFQCESVAQNPELPCAQLFDKQYCHRTHPATLLLYRALGFVKPPALDHYVWNGVPHDLAEVRRHILAHMAVGTPVV